MKYLLQVDRALWQKFKAAIKADKNYSTMKSFLIEQIKSYINVQEK